MSLDDLYINRVQGKSSAMLNLTFNGSAPSFERDPEIIKLESNVFSQLMELGAEPTNNTINSNVVSQQVSFVSFEDALKELAELKVNI